jgi:putative pyruvate formate lyase activating enzyme
MSGSHTFSDWPSYLKLLRSGQLAERAERAGRRLRRCTMCPRRCRVDRLAGELGMCCTGALARVASAGPHFGEEAPLVGRGGSGSIFFAGCNLACVFCQNHDISQPAGDPPARVAGERPLADPAVRATAQRALTWEKDPDQIARTMLELQDVGCENINLVSPSHVVPQILAALVPAAEQGLRLPLVYNTGGYDALATLRLLDGIVDIYMPDMKYADDQVGLRLSGVPDYARHNRVAVREMHRQVGDLELDGRGVAHRGLLVRQLVLPGNLAGTAETARFIASELSSDTYVNVMDQYRPAHEAFRYPEVSRLLAAPEYRQALEEAVAAGLWRLDGVAMNV